MEIESYGFKDHINKNELFMEITMSSGDSHIYRELFKISHHKTHIKFSSSLKKPEPWKESKGWRNLFIDEQDKVVINGFTIRKNKVLISLFKRIEERVMEFIGLSKQELIRRIEERIGNDEFIGLEELCKRLS